MLHELIFAHRVVSFIDFDIFMASRDSRPRARAYQAFTTSAWSTLRTRHHTNYRYMMNLDETISGFYIVAPLRVDCFHLGEKHDIAEGHF